MQKRTVGQNLIKGMRSSKRTRKQRKTKEMRYEKEEVCCVGGVDE